MKIPFLFCVVFAVFNPVLALADETLLTISINGETREYDRKALVAIGTASFKTTTIWTDGVQDFEGVPMSALVEELGVATGTLKAVANNDYAIEIPIDDETTPAALLALKRNGAEMGVRDNGPLWLVYPYDSKPEFQSEVIYARSIWQLVHIDVLP